MFVTRERGEHVNMFHSMTDFLNAFQSLEMLEIDPKNVQVVLLDDHAAGPFDSLWNTVFSQRSPMRRVKDFTPNSSGERNNLLSSTDVH